MMLTEDEARKKWCPMVRLAEATAPPGYPSRNRGTLDDDAHPLCRCIASGCMAWRWHVRKRQGLAPAGHADEPAPTHGYCGAFGRPGDA